MTLEKYLLLFFLLTIFSCKEDNQNRNVENKKNELIQQEVRKTQGLLVCNNKHINLKKIKKDSVIKQSFIFYNSGNEPVELLEYEASCNCTELKLSKYNVFPKDSVSIQMIIETKDKGIGNHIINTTIKTNGQRTFYHLSLKFELVN